MEAAILGAILLERDAIDLVLEIFDEPDVFYAPEHRAIFEAILSMRRQYRAIDLLTLIPYMRENGLLNDTITPYSITKLTNTVVSSAHIQDHSRIVYQAYMKRMLIRSGGDMITAGYDETVDVFDAFDRAQQALQDIIQKTAKGEVKAISASVSSVVNRVAALQSGAINKIEIDTGYTKLNKLNNGWTPTDLVIIAARPAVGKTAFSLNLAYNAARTGTPTAYFSLEMSAEQLTQRVISNDSQLFLEKLKNGELGPHDAEILQQSAERVSRLPLYIDDDAGINVMQMKSRLRKLVDKYGVKLVFVDYLQLMGAKDDNRNRNREQEVSANSRELKVMAKQLNVCVVALSQLSRSVEQRSGGQVPQLSDLRESGAIEQDADEVFFLYAPTDAAIAQDASLKNVRYVKGAKDRDGKLGEIELQFYGATQTFMNYGERPQWQDSYTQTNAGTYRDAPAEDEDGDGWSLV